jgi:hypothetical protein
MLGRADAADSRRPLADPEEMGRARQHHHQHQHRLGRSNGYPGNGASVRECGGVVVVAALDRLALGMKREG